MPESATRATFKSNYARFATKILLRARGFSLRERARACETSEAVRIPKEHTRRVCDKRKSDFWERSGPTEGGGSTPQVCGRAPAGCTPPEGWCSRAAERSGECGAKRKNSRTCTRRVQVHAHAHVHGAESAHGACTRRVPPEG